MEEYWFEIFIYSSFLIAFYAALSLEYKDLFCPDEKQEAKIGNGAAYEKGKPEKNDTFHTLLAKIRISSRYDESSVYWRRTIVFSILLTFTILLLVLRRFPTAYEILVSFVVLYLFTFLFLIYYQEVVSKQATKQVNDATNLLSRFYN